MKVWGGWGGGSGVGGGGFCWLGVVAGGKGTGERRGVRETLVYD